MRGPARTESLVLGPQHAYPEFLAEGRGLCANAKDKDAFTLEATGTEQKRRVRHAVAVCRMCPFKEQCKRWALDHHPQEGVYGGTTTRGREMLLGLRGRGGGPGGKGD